MSTVLDALTDRSIDRWIDDGNVVHFRCLWLTLCRDDRDHPAVWSSQRYSMQFSSGIIILGIINHDQLLIARIMNAMAEDDRVGCGRCHKWDYGMRTDVITHGFYHVVVVVVVGPPLGPALNWTEAACGVLVPIWWWASYVRKPVDWNTFNYGRN